MIYVDLDFETRSLADLKVVGADRYAQDVSTQVLCLALHGNSQHGVWFPGVLDDCMDSWLRIQVENPDVIFVAHNAGFEQAIWRWIMVQQHGFPPLPAERWDCTMAACAWKGIPLKLDAAQRALRLAGQKDKAGNKLTIGLSRADKKTGNVAEITPDILRKVSAYCAQDVVVEEELRKRIGLISHQNANERRVWLYDQAINQRGIRIDLDFVHAAKRVVDRAKVPLLAEFKEITSGLEPGQTAKLRDWCALHGLALPNMQKETLAKLLKEPEVDDAGYESLADATEFDGAMDRSELSSIASRVLPSDVRRMLEIRSVLGSSSITKLDTMLACVGYDGRARGLLQYHAAGPGRWGGRIIQPQNFPRGDWKRKGITVEQTVAAIMSGDPNYVERSIGTYVDSETGEIKHDGAIQCVADSLRHALVPDPGRVFLVGDYAGIEMRVVLALAGQTDKTRLLATGKDVYLDMAAQIYGRSGLTKDNVVERTIGKNTVLGCGFQMGGDRFHERYCPHQPLSFAHEVVQTYREEWAPEVPELWKGLQRASLAAVKTGRPHDAYGVVYRREGEFLTASLPSGWQKLWYYRPELGINKFDMECWFSWTSKNGKWVRRSMYGGLETENAVQGLARGLLCGAIDRVEKAGMPVVLTVHDEIVCEIDQNVADLSQFEKLMAAPTEWSERIGIPISVETPGQPTKRYSK